jgi:tetratricopeptide (TPR) repeat protein
LAGRAYAINHYGRARELINRAFSLHNEADDHELQASALILLGNIALDDEDDLNTGREMFTQALAHAQLVRDMPKVRLARKRLTEISTEEGDTDAAFAEASALVAESGEAEDCQMEAHARRLRGVVHFHRGDMEGARAELEQSLRLSLAEGDDQQQRETRSLLDELDRFAR